MQDLENYTLKGLKLDLLFYIRYVDAIALAAPADKINTYYYSRYSIFITIDCSLQLNMSLIIVLVFLTYL